MFIYELLPIERNRIHIAIMVSLRNICMCERYVNTRSLYFTYHTIPLIFQAHTHTHMDQIYVKYIFSMSTSCPDRELLVLTAIEKPTHTFAQIVGPMLTIRNS